MIAIREMQVRNIPTSDCRLYINVRDMEYLRGDWNLSGTRTRGAYANIFGVDVYLIDGKNSYIEARELW